MLTIELFNNTYFNAQKSQGSIENKLFCFQIGFLEACLVHFGIITEEASSVRGFANTVSAGNFLFWRFSRKETREEVIMRLSATYLKKHYEGQ